MSFTPFVDPESIKRKTYAELLQERSVLMTDDENILKPLVSNTQNNSVIEEIDYEKQEEEKRMLEVIKEEMNELQVRSDDKESTDNIQIVEEKVTEVPGIAVQ